MTRRYVARWSKRPSRIEAGAWGGDMAYAKVSEYLRSPGGWRERDGQFARRGEVDAEDPEERGGTGVGGGRGDDSEGGGSLV